jgi:amino acid permease
VIGSGILTIPYTFKKMGFGLGIMLFLVAACINQFGSVLLLKAKNLSRHSNYSTIVHHIYPTRMARGVGAFIIFIGSLGVCTPFFMQVSASSSSSRPRCARYLWT